jgi:IgGFc binding protein
MKRLLLISSCVWWLACEAAPTRIELPELPGRAGEDAGKPVFTCEDETTRACEGGVAWACRRNAEFIEAVATDCLARGEVCDVRWGCVLCIAGEYRCKVCEPGDTTCSSDTVQRCDTSTSWQDVMTCDIRKGDACDGSGCVNACDLAAVNRSYVGCEFYAVDLDNAAIDDVNDAAAQQYAVVVANPQRVPVSVWVERNDGVVGASAEVDELARKLVPAGDIEVFPLPRREVDGASSTGLNDGTGTALTSNAYRIVSTHPITAYQFNPLENVNVFSNDASLLLPTSALDTTYTVVAWPQTIGDSKSPEQDFDSTRSDEDLRSFLTIVGTREGTRVEVQFGADVIAVLGAGPIPRSRPGDVITHMLGPFDVLNLETAGFNADFSGTRVVADKPVSVFVGSEASDVPTFGTYETRRCCADHLEEQLLPDVSAGSRFIIARMPQRTRALNAAAEPGAPLGVAITDEPEWVRIVATAKGTTRVKTTLDGEDTAFTLEERAHRMLRADRDFVIEADRPIGVLHALPSQAVSGIPKQYPGGDPSIVIDPPIEQYRRDYIFLTPDKYAFDFVVIIARKDASVLLDGAPLPAHCETSDVDVDPKHIADVDAFEVHRCQLSFPIVTRGLNSVVKPGMQNDGVHTLVSNHPMGVLVYGFDRFVSYAYPGGLNLDVLN